MKLLLLSIVFCLTVTIISSRTATRPGSPVDSPVCKRHGDDCISSDECCSNVKMTCNRFAGRCQVVITRDDLLEGKAKLKKTGHHLF
ncbi:omega-conotoxin-like protein 1 [Leptopilina boulardi]|uniref:omega-conotoxin-like protein 1 n=1 Tax=Leptopilina boulardi TaxID=63433 RepID=UPI0021F60508|nr:omega-conotoxin-like protein 1 [Leptopilina boulardi]XP_051154013.1 omega-conotoxin-like protein 1 [Leptopilina boulardi]